MLSVVVVRLVSYSDKSCDYMRVESTSLMRGLGDRH